jgi:broad specificity phosphatase PhoE
MNSKQFCLICVSLVGFAGLGIAANSALGPRPIHPIDHFALPFFSKISRWYKNIKKRRRAQRIILVRHGESEGNIDPSIYETVPDCNLRLTKRGEEQALEAGKKLAELLRDDLACCYVSPYIRTQQTLATMLNAAHVNPENIVIRLDPRLREQDFGNLQRQHMMAGYKEERLKVGTFWYRFPEGGESGADVYDRVSLFMETLFRELNDWTRPRWKNVVLVVGSLFCFFNTFVSLYNYNLFAFHLQALTFTCWILFLSAMA